MRPSGLRSPAHIRRESTPPLADDAKRLKELERANSTLKRLLADAELEKAALKEIASETSEPGPPAGRPFTTS
ncbi:MAG: hypothetical protein JWP39_2604 [Jatrophihabitans sp.]|nr:hypothetical protein [Jatrophihabitans sp.]